MNSAESSAPSAVTVVLVEDDARVREAIARRIGSEPRLCLRAAVGTCREALAALERERPQVFIVDLGLPDGDGLDLIATAHALDPDMDIVVVTVFGDEERVVGAIRAGASGYLLKDQPGPELTTAILDLVAGQAPISPGIAHHLIRGLRAGGSACASGEPQPELTEREREILNLIAKGFSYKECARLLELSVNTVAAHIKRVYRKLAVGSRGEAIFEAQRLGLLDRGR